MKEENLQEIIDRLVKEGKTGGVITYELWQRIISEQDLSKKDFEVIVKALESQGIKVAIKSNWREWVESIVVAFLLAMFIRTFFIQAFKIPSGSMQNTLLIGDRLMVNKLRFGPKVPFTHMRLPGFGKPERGDVIVFIFPDDPKRDFIKRLIAFGEETVEIRDGDIYVNDKLVEEPRIKSIEYYNRGPYAERGSKVKVPKGYVFVLGDNSQSSHDSRYWGFVPEENIIGRAEFVYWPFNRMGMIQ